MRCIKFASPIATAAVRDAIRELSQLTDRELDDIGIRRGDIPFIAANAARAA